MNKKEIESIKRIFKIDKDTDIIPLYVSKLMLATRIVYYRKNSSGSLFELDRDGELLKDDDLELLDAILEENFIRFKNESYLLKDLSDFNISLDLENNSLTIFPNFSLEPNFCFRFGTDRDFLKGLIINEKFKEIKLLIELIT